MRRFWETSNFSSISLSCPKFRRTPLIDNITFQMPHIKIIYICAKLLVHILKYVFRAAQNRDSRVEISSRRKHLYTFWSLTIFMPHIKNTILDLLPLRGTHFSLRIDKFVVLEFIETSQFVWYIDKRENRVVEIARWNYLKSKNFQFLNSKINKCKTKRHQLSKNFSTSHIFMINTKKNLKLL